VTASNSSFEAAGGSCIPPFFIDAEVRECPGRQNAGGVQSHFHGRNRSWTLENYMAMLTHILLAQAHNLGASTRILD
jgi:hypothetical protein